MEDNVVIHNIWWKISRNDDLLEEYSEGLISALQFALILLNLSIFLIGCGCLNEDDDHRSKRIIAGFILNLADVRTKNKGSKYCDYFALLPPADFILLQTS
jgi:hypothetical protein